jgi:hypothetical protein
MLHLTRLIILTCSLAGFAALFSVVSTVGGLGPGELTSVLLITVPVSLALLRAFTTLLGLNARAEAEAS